MKIISMTLNQSLKNKFLIIFKNYFTNLYCFLSTLIENIFFKKEKTANQLYKYGYNVYNLGVYSNYKNYEFKTIKSNKYLNKLILTKDSIDALIQSLFLKNNLSNLITKETGFKYSIDFMTAYETFHVSDEDTEKGWYANHWHRDKPFSKNTLKIILPLEKITELHGGIEIKNKLDPEQIFKMIADKNEFLIFYPNRCFHKAGNPGFNLSRKQIMFQLNPAFSWKINTNLYERQKFIEPKFPLVSYLLDKKKFL